MARVTFPRLPRRTGLQSASNGPVDEENQFRSQVEQAFEQLPKGGGSPTPSGGGADENGYYVVDRASNKPAHGIVVPRALGPDRIPASPDAMDDYMTDLTTGYDSSLWTKWSAGSTATYQYDELGGLAINMLDNDGTVRGIEQSFAGFGGDWSFSAKVSMSTPFDAGNSYAGITIRDSSGGHIEMLCMGRQGTNTKVADFRFSGPSSYSSGTISNLNQGTGMNPTDWYYIRVSGSGSSYLFEISTNGVAYTRVTTGTLYPASPDKIGLFTYRDDSLWGNAYFQWFRNNS